MVTRTAKGRRPRTTRPSCSTSRSFETLPYFVSFSQFSPIPEAKDTKAELQQHPLATGPYMFKTFTQGTKLELVKRNPNWDPNTDPARHQYVDGFHFNFGGRLHQDPAAILACNGTTPPR